MDDLISRREAIEVLAEMQGRCTTKEALIQNSKIWQQIKDLPPAEPERKKGRWEYETMRHLITGEMRTVRICSVCDGGWFRYDMSDGVEEAEPNYCPNCGADMRGEGNDDRDTD